MDLWKHSSDTTTVLNSRTAHRNLHILPLDNQSTLIGTILGAFIQRAIKLVNPTDLLFVTEPYD